MVGVKILPAIRHIVRAVLVIVLDIPDENYLYNLKTTYSYLIFIISKHEIGMIKTQHRIVLLPFLSVLRMLWLTIIVIIIIINITIIITITFIIVIAIIIPNCSVALPAGVENALADNPLGVAKNWIAGLVGSG